MSHARPPRDGPPIRGHQRADQDGSAASKVVMMELLEAAGPLSADELVDRTLLSESAVTSALSDLQDMGLCRERPGDDRRPTRFVAEEPSATDESTTADDQSTADD